MADEINTLVGSHIDGQMRVIEVVSAPFADTCAEFCERVYARYS